MTIWRRQARFVSMTLNGLHVLLMTKKIGEGTVVTIEEIRGVKLIVKQNKED